MLLPMYFECTRKAFIQISIKDPQSQTLERRKVEVDLEFYAVYGIRFFAGTMDDDPDHEDPLSKAVAREIVRALEALPKERVQRSS